MKQRYKAAILVFVCVLVLLLITLRVYVTMGYDSSKEIGSLEYVRKSSHFLKHTTELQLAKSEMLFSKIEDTLSFDDYLFFNYTSSTVQCQIYIAYWTGGKVPIKTVAEHRPDICWVKNGMQMINSDSHTSQKYECQFRLFEHNGDQIEVAYWHIWNGRLVNDYAMGMVSKTRFLEDIFQYGIFLKGEQMFLRISTVDGDIAQALKDEKFSIFLDEMLQPFLDLPKH